MRIMPCSVIGLNGIVFVEGFSFILSRFLKKSRGAMMPIVEVERGLPVISSLTGVYDSGVRLSNLHRMTKYVVRP